MKFCDSLRRKLEVTHKFCSSQRVASAVSTSGCRSVEKLSSVPLLFLILKSLELWMFCSRALDVVENRPGILYEALEILVLETSEFSACNYLLPKE